MAIKGSISRHLPQANIQPVTANTAPTTTANAAPVKSGMVETSPMVEFIMLPEALMTPHLSRSVNKYKQAIV